MAQLRRDATLRSMVRTNALLTLAALSAGLPAAAAAAPSVTYDRACYGAASILHETGTGFTPNGSVSERITGGDLLPDGTFQGQASLTAPDAPTDAAGGFVRDMRVPDPFDDTDLRETVVADFTDSADASLTARSTWTLSAWAIDFREWRKGKVDPKGKLTVNSWGWSGSGRGDTLYLHYFRGSKFVGKVKVGTLVGDCGDVSARVPQFPKKSMPAGTYTVYASTTSKLDKVNDGWISVKVRVRVARASSNAVAGLTVRHPLRNALGPAEPLGRGGSAWER